MTSQILISSLTPRSGKSIKFAAKNVLKIEAEQVSYSLFLFSSKEGKIGVLVRGAELETLKLSVGKNYLVKNLHYQEEISGIPVFKLVKQSVFRESSVAPPECIDFTKKEIDSLKLISAKDYYDVPLQVNPSEPAQMSSNTLSLLDFVNTDPENIKDNQFVEV